MVLLLLFFRSILFRHLDAGPWSWMILGPWWEEHRGNYVGRQKQKGSFANTASVCCCFCFCLWLSVFFLHVFFCFASRLCLNPLSWHNCFFVQGYLSTILSPYFPLKGIPFRHLEVNENDEQNRDIGWQNIFQDFESQSCNQSIPYWNQNWAQCFGGFECKGKAAAMSTGQSSS